MFTPRVTQIFVLGVIVLVGINWDRLQDIDFIFPLTSTLFLFYFLKLFENFGKRIVLIDVLELLSVNNLLFIPSLFERLDQEYLEEIQLGFPLSDKYFLLAIPSVLAMLAAFAIPLKKRYEHEKVRMHVQTDENFQKIGFILFGGGMFFTLVDNFFPLGFISELFSGVAKVGILYLVFSNQKIHKVLMFSYFGVIMLDSLGRGMIGEFFWWIALIGMFYLLAYPITIWQKLSGAVLFFFLIGIIQSVKAEYRMATWKNEGELAGMSSTKIYTHLINDKLSYGELFSLEESLGVLGRFNQGYLTAMSLDYTPANEPFAKGETIYMAIASSLVPRVLWPDKPEAGGREKMERFAGVELGETTSMNIGLLGEAYVNFGFTGAAIFLFFYGLMLNFVYATFLDAGQERPYIMLWLPVAFFGLISFETDLVTTLNHLVKFLIFFFFLYHGILNVFKIKMW